MGELAWRDFRRSNVFIPEYFLKGFYRLKFTATRATIVSSEGPVSFRLLEDAVTTYMDLSKQLKNRLHPTICCSEVISVTLDVFPGCKNIGCGRPVVAIPDHPSTLCQKYKTTMKVSKCPCIFHCTLTLKDIEIPLNLPLEVLQSYLELDVITFCSKQNIKSFKDSLLFTEKVDYFYNTKNVITHMKKHWPTLFSSLNFTYKLYIYCFFIIFCIRF